ncbi:MAG: nucleotidyl transferase AbiEii/AbiGii toxin family protein [Deltaproteobacteria bacterium]|nr:nucleotidyl transferase AbiEii/AbiGii toxin family protein [Deltaproteobacteria bacterium]
MFKDVLSEGQQRLLPLIHKFQNDFYLAGGTAIALQIGHRRSIDFDLFSRKSLNTLEIVNIIKRSALVINTTLEETTIELTLVVNGVKVTFLEYPFDIKPSLNLDNIIMMPDLLTLASTKAYSLGRRSKWKDYVDLYFIFRDHFTSKDVSQKAKEIFGGGFNERLFREQLCYFEDVDFSEGIDFFKGRINDETIKGFLEGVATEL